MDVTYNHFNQSLKMKNYLLTFLFVTVAIVTAFSQSDSAVFDDAAHCYAPNYFVLINGKLPLSMHTVFRIESELYPDSIIYYFRNNFKSYSIKDKIWNLCEDISDSAKVYIKYVYDEPVGWYKKYKHLVYCDTLLWGTFKMIGIVIINDINVKKHLYYIHYELEPPWGRYVVYKKEYGNRKRFYKKIFRGIYPVGFDIQEKNNHPRGRPFPKYR